MSTRDGHSRTSNEQTVTRFPARPHLRIVKDELGAEEEMFVGGAMSLASDHCADDRPRTADGPGVWLRRNRAAHGLTLDDIARSTKITKPILIALESSDVLRLPAPIYTRGFVKAYAREVGLDPDRTADDYLAQIEPLGTQHLRADAGQPPPAARTTDASLDVKDGTGHPLSGHQLRRFGWLTTAVALAGLVVYLTSFADRDAGENAAGITAPAAIGDDAVPAGRTAPLDAAIADATRAAGDPLQVEIRTQGLCWVVIRVDGEPTLERLLQPGEQHTFDVSEEALMRVGDPGTLTLTINGQAARPLGTAGEPVDVRITPTNFREFLGASTGPRPSSLP